MPCKDCVSWTPIAESEDGLREGEARTFGFGCCGHEAFHVTYTPTSLPQDGVWIEEDEGWGFFTGPLFECIHFTARP